MSKAARRPYDRVKRTLDVIISGLVLILSFPLQLIVAALVAANLGRPVLFTQVRPGLDGELFTILKFRTMKDALPGQGIDDDAERLTRFGQFLRSTSLDELPALVNVFKGDMSIVGPRPLLVDYLPRYSPHQARRHEVRPGVTGLAQVSGRNTISWNERFELDVFYVENRSLALDLRIIGKTIWTVVRREGIKAEGHATMTEFTGIDAKEVDHD